MTVVSGNSVSLAHRILWDSSQRHLEIALERSEDSWILHLSAALLAAAAFEAYLNYAGGEILPDVWANERRVFTSETYRGPMGKFKRIAEEIDWEVPPISRRPLSGVREIQRLRDKIVHARPETAAYCYEVKRSQSPEHPSMWLLGKTPPRKLHSLIADVEALAVLLHAAIGNSNFRGILFGTHPFRGALGFGTEWVADGDQRRSDQKHFDGRRSPFARDSLSTQRGRRGGLERAPQHEEPGVPEAEVREDRSEGHQSLRG